VTRATDQPAGTPAHDGREVVTASSGGDTTLMQAAVNAARATVATGCTTVTGELAPAPLLM